MSRRRIASLINGVGAHGIRGRLVFTFNRPWYTFFGNRCPRLIRQLAHALEINLRQQSGILNDRFETLNAFYRSRSRVRQSRCSFVVHRCLGVSNVVAGVNEIGSGRCFRRKVATIGGLRLHGAGFHRRSASWHDRETFLASNRLITELENNLTD